MLGDPEVARDDMSKPSSSGIPAVKPASWNLGSTCDMVSTEPRDVGVPKAGAGRPPLRARASSSVRCDDTLDWRPVENMGTGPALPPVGADLFLLGACFCKPGSSLSGS